MSKSQVNFRLPDELIAALKDRAESEGITSTELATRLLETGLGLPSPENKSDDSRIEDRIASHLAPLQEQLDRRIEERIHAVIQNEVNAVLGEFHATRAESNSQAELKELRSQLELLQSEHNKLSEHLHGQATKAEKAQELEQELKELRSHLATAEREALADSREKAATGSELSEFLEPLPDKIDNGGWLSLKEAYKLAQERGYAGSKTGFMQVRDATFRKLGFEVDRSRRIPGGNQNSRWLRPLDPT